MYRRTLTLAVLLSLFATPMLNAQEKRKVANRKQVLQYLAKLRAAAKEAKEKGDEDKLKKIYQGIRKAELYLKASEDKKIKSEKKYAGKGDAEEKQIIADLNRGLLALKKLGLGKQAAVIAQQAEKALVARRKKLGYKKRALTEREVAKRYIQIFEMAIPVYKESGNKKAVSMLEHIVKARSLALSGKRDKETIGYIKEMPKLGQQVELLSYASKLWTKYGDKEKAHATGELAKVLYAAFKRRQGRESRSGTRKVRGRYESEKAIAARKKREDDRVANEKGQVKALEARISRLENAIERLIKASRRDDDK